MVGLNDYRGPFQPKQFCATRYHRNSMTERVKLRIYIYAFIKCLKPFETKYSQVMVELEKIKLNQYRKGRNC